MGQRLKFRKWNQTMSTILLATCTFLTSNQNKCTAKEVESAEPQNRSNGSTGNIQFTAYWNNETGVVPRVVWAGQLADR